jgi:hypothetical protein
MTIMRMVISINMRTVILVKTIICDEWTLHNKLRASMLIEPSVKATGLMPRFYLMSRYYIGSFYSRLYSALNKDGYFNEDD